MYEYRFWITPIELGSFLHLARPSEKFSISLLNKLWFTGHSHSSIAGWPRSKPHISGSKLPEAHYVRIFKFEQNNGERKNGKREEQSNPAFNITNFIHVCLHLVSVLCVCTAEHMFLVLHVHESAWICVPRKMPIYERVRARLAIIIIVGSAVCPAHAASETVLLSLFYYVSAGGILFNVVWPQRCGPDKAKTTITFEGAFDSIALSYWILNMPGLQHKMDWSNPGLECCVHANEDDWSHLLCKRMRERKEEIWFNNSHDDFSPLRRHPIASEPGWLIRFHLCLFVESIFSKYRNGFWVSWMIFGRRSTRIAECRWFHLGRLDPMDHFPEHVIGCCTTLFYLHDHRITQRFLRNSTLNWKWKCVEKSVK